MDKQRTDTNYKFTCENCKKEVSTVYIEEGREVCYECSKYANEKT